MTLLSLGPSLRQLCCQLDATPFSLAGAKPHTHDANICIVCKPRLPAVVCLVQPALATRLPHPTATSHAVQAHCQEVAAVQPAPGAIMATSLQHASAAASGKQRRAAAYQKVGGSQGMSSLVEHCTCNTSFCWPRLRKQGRSACTCDWACCPASCWPRIRCTHSLLCCDKLHFAMDVLWVQMDAGHVGRHLLYQNLTQSDL